MNAHQHIETAYCADCLAITPIHFKFEGEDIERGEVFGFEYCADCGSEDLFESRADYVQNHPRPIGACEACFEQEPILDDDYCFACIWMNYTTPDTAPTPPCDSSIEPLRVSGCDDEPGRAVRVGEEV